MRSVIIANKRAALASSSEMDKKKKKKTWVKVQITASNDRHVKQRTTKDEHSVGRKRMQKNIALTPNASPLLGQPYFFPSFFFGIPK